jgi:formylglycine-generating enzyme
MRHFIPSRARSVVLASIESIHPSQSLVCTPNQRRHDIVALCLVLAFGGLSASCVGNSDCNRTATCPMDASSDTAAQPSEYGGDATAESPRLDPRADDVDSGSHTATPDRLVPLASTDAPTTAALGAVCATATECSSGYCVDGVCCDSACDGARCDVPEQEGWCGGDGPKSSADAGLETESDAAVETPPTDAGVEDAGRSDACAGEDCGRDDRPECLELGTCECTPAQSRSCAEAGYLGSCAAGTQTCTTDGEWGDCSIRVAGADSCARGADETCDGMPNAPLDASCECLAGDRECVAGTPSTAARVCSSTGQWGAPLACQFACTGEGVCSGVCTPGDKVCDGNSASECNLAGEWQVQGPCEAATPCQGAGQCSPCADGTYASNGVCVPFSQCAPGEFVSSPGTSTSDRQCSPCAIGTFSEVNNAATCTAWTSCAAGQFITDQGTETSDRQCGTCGPGTFSGSTNATSCGACSTGKFAADEGSSSCATWSTCPAGEFVTASGTASTDRACAACEFGTFSTIPNASECTPYQRCNTGYTEATPGTLTSDRSCKSIPSCAGLSVMCGADFDENCCTSLPVSGGNFDLMNNDAYPSTVSEFQLDKFEVTVGRFRKFKEAWDDGYRPLAGSGKHTHLNEGNGLVNNDSSTTHESGWDSDWDNQVSVLDAARGSTANMATWTPTAQKNERLPVNHVNWYEAYAFCIWDGGFLPSAAERNYASAGGDEQRRFPWANPPTSSVISASHAAYACLANGEADDCTLADFIEVGSKPTGDGRFGQSDLVGNVAEWVLDEYPANAACADCAYLPNSLELRTLQGGSYSDPSTVLETFRIDMFPPETRDDEVGFRCARVL